MKALKINNSLWVTQLGKFVAKYHEIINIPGVGYEQLITYFANMAQMGGNIAEFWVVFDEEEPVALASWSVRGLPYRGVVYCDHMYSWGKRTKAVQLLIDEFEKFAQKNNCLIGEASANNEIVYSIFNKYGKKRGYKITKSGVIGFTMRKE